MLGWALTFFVIAILAALYRYRRGSSWSCQGSLRSFSSSVLSHFLCSSG
jgi:hypothetical protein